MTIRDADDARSIADHEIPRCYRTAIDHDRNLGRLYPYPGSARDRDDVPRKNWQVGIRNLVTIAHAAVNDDGGDAATFGDEDRDPTQKRNRQAAGVNHDDVTGVCAINVCGDVERRRWVRVTNIYAGLNGEGSAGEGSWLADGAQPRRKAIDLQVV